MDKLESFKQGAVDGLGNFQRGLGAGGVRISEQSKEAYDYIIEFLSSFYPQDAIGKSCDSVISWGQSTLGKIQQTATNLSPYAWYEDLWVLWTDEVWRRGILVFISGVACGMSIGVMLGVGWCRDRPRGPQCRALTSTYDASVLFVNDHLVPDVGANEVLVRVQAFSVCPVDRAVLRGRGAALRGLLYNTHVTVGRGFAGVILDTGAGVSAFELGDEVWGCVSEWTPGAGTELLVVSSSRVSKRPRGLAADSAASIPYAGVRALGTFNRLSCDKDNNIFTNKRLCIVGAETPEGCVLTALSVSKAAHVTVAAHKHHHATLLGLGASEAIDFCGTAGTNCWTTLEHQAALSGPWDAVILCTGNGQPATRAVLRSSAPRKAMIDLRPHALITDRLPSPITILFAASFYAVRALRWLVGLGPHTEWLDDKHHLSGGLKRLTEYVDDEEIQPILDKVFLPEEFETALAHACSDDAFGTTVIRFP